VPTLYGGGASHLSDHFGAGKKDSALVAVRRKSVGKIEIDDSKAKLIAIVRYSRALL
jgi:hypothetical protein